MKTLLIAGILGTGFFLSGCVLPVFVERHHDSRYYDDGRNGYPVKVDVAPVVEFRR